MTNQPELSSSVSWLEFSAERANKPLGEWFNELRHLSVYGSRTDADLIRVSDFGSTSPFSWILAQRAAIIILFYIEFQGHTNLETNFLTYLSISEVAPTLV